MKGIEMEQMDWIIKAENLSYYYPVEGAPNKNVLHGINLEIQRGSFTAIIGHNGSGKSTLAKLLCAVLAPCGGNVFINGKDNDKNLSVTYENDIFDIRKTVGMVFQNPDNQLVASVVEEDVAFAPENIGVEPSEIRRRVDNALETVGLSDFALHDTHKLSGGQKQRVAIAGILAMLPECIIFDESTAMLDPKGREDILSTITKLKDELGITVILITHYMNEAAMADRIIVMEDGNIIADGNPKEVFSKDALLYQSGLELPQATELCKKLYESGIDICPVVLNADEAVDEILKVYKRLYS